MEFQKVEGYVYYNLPVFSLGTEEWVIGTQKRFRKAAEEKIKEDLWAFDTKYICKFLQEKRALGCDWGEVDWRNFKHALSSLQQNMCESANPVIQALIGCHLNDFVTKTTESLDELGNILGRYDGRIHPTRSIRGLNTGYGPLCFRL